MVDIAQIAKRTGLHYSTVSNYLQGVGKPHDFTCKMMEGEGYYFCKNQPAKRYTFLKRSGA